MKVKFHAEQHEEREDVWLGSVELDGFTVFADTVAYKDPEHAEESMRNLYQDAISACLFDAYVRREQFVEAGRR